MAIELNQEHYELLKKCSESENFEQWNKFVKTTTTIIRLRGGDFSGWNLKGASFHTPGGELMDLHDANFNNSSIQGADFSGAKLFEATFEQASIELSSFSNADLTRARFTEAEITMTNFNQAILNYASFKDAHINASDLYEASFYRADLTAARFNGAFLLIPGRSNLCGTDFREAKLNSGTYFENYQVSNKTDFRTVSFESANFSQGLRQTLRYCNRRHNWNDWYKNKKLPLRTITKFFWSLSNYGHSPIRVLTSFATLTLLFALIYLVFPQIITGLKHHDLIKSIYFSIVTMTTLGFGDMHAGDSWVAQILVIFQVLFGYLLLGSLITMLSEFFYSDGPSQELSPHESKPNFMIATIKDA